MTIIIVLIKYIITEAIVLETASCLSSVHSMNTGLRHGLIWLAIGIFKNSPWEPQKQITIESMCCLVAFEHSLFSKSPYKKWMLWCKN